MSEAPSTIKLATRGSPLARQQAHRVERALEDYGLEVEIVEVSTEGDEIRDELIRRLGKTGAFTRALDEQVIEGEVDAAVHSMKDLPTERPDSLVIAAVPPRGPPEDVLVTPREQSFDELPEGAVVGTSSLRREAEILAERSDLMVKPMRGNVDTRIEKLLAPHRQRAYQRRLDDEAISEEELQSWFDSRYEIEKRALEREVETAYDAVVLARAGLERSNLLHQLDYQPLSRERFVPAPAQGALAITASEAPTIEAINTAIDDPQTRVEVTVERQILATIGGGCIAPIGVNAHLRGEIVQTVVAVFDPTNDDHLRASRELPVERHPHAARDFAHDLIDRGASERIERARALES